MACWLALACWRPIHRAHYLLRDALAACFLLGNAVSMSCLSGPLHCRKCSGTEHNFDAKRAHYVPFSIDTSFERESQRLVQWDSILRRI